MLAPPVNSTCVFICICTHIYIYVYIYMCVCVCVCVWVRVERCMRWSRLEILCVCTCIGLYIYTCLCVYVYVCVCICACVYVLSAACLPAPMNHAKIFKGRRFASWELVQGPYKTFPPDHIDQVEINKSTILSNKSSTA